MEDIIKYHIIPRLSPLDIPQLQCSAKFIKDYVLQVPLFAEIVAARIKMCGENLMFGNTAIDRDDLSAIFAHCVEHRLFHFMKWYASTTNVTYFDITFAYDAAAICGVDESEIAWIGKPKHNEMLHNMFLKLQYSTLPQNVPHQFYIQFINRLHQCGKNRNLETVQRMIEWSFESYSFISAVLDVAIKDDNFACIDYIQKTYPRYGRDLLYFAGYIDEVYYARPSMYAMACDVPRLKAILENTYHIDERLMEVLNLYIKKSRYDLADVVMDKFGSFVKHMHSQNDPVDTHIYLKNYFNWSADEHCKISLSAIQVHDLMPHQLSKYADTIFAQGTKATVKYYVNLLSADNLPAAPHQTSLDIYCSRLDCDPSVAKTMKKLYPYLTVLCGKCPALRRWFMRVKSNTARGL